MSAMRVFFFCDGISIDQHFRVMSARWSNHCYKVNERYFKYFSWKSIWSHTLMKQQGFGAMRWWRHIIVCDVLDTGLRPRLHYFCQLVRIRWSDIFFFVARIRNRLAVFHCFRRFRLYIIQYLNLICLAKFFAVLNSVLKCFFRRMSQEDVFLWN